MFISNKKRYSIKPGFTLIELIVTMGILGIVLAMAYSIGAFGNTSFSNGSSKSNIQSNIRLASNYITKELRYSSNATVLATFPDNPDPTEKYIYVDNGVLKQYYNGNIINIVGDNSGNIKTTLQFQIQDAKTVYFNIEEVIKNQTFQLGSTVLLLNIGSNNLISGNGAVISYTPGQSMITNINARPVQSISITAPSNSISINGGTLQLTSNITPSDASIKTVTWSVNDSSLATIDSNGLLKTVTNTIGKTIIVTATSQDGSGVSGTYTVTTADLPIKKVTALKVASDYDFVFNNGGTLQMKIGSVTPADATNQAVTWSIDQPSIATIDQNTGLLTTKTTDSNKTITVTATAKDGSNVTNSKTVTIKSVYITDPTGKYTITVYGSSGSLQLYCYVSPDGVAASAPVGVSALTWSVSGSDKASIDNNGNLTIHNGNISNITLTVTVTAILNDGKTSTTATQNIKVNK